jgi:hypothetical protein
VAGFATWMDVKDILPGQIWAEEIQKEIRGADFFIAFISQNTFTKTGFIQKEIRMALDLYKRQPETGMYVIPVRLDPVVPPAPFAEIQWIDIFSPDDYQKLISSIKTVWGKRKS